MTRSLTAEHLCEILSYDPETGHFTRTKKVNRNTVVGSRAGSPTHYGYLRINIRGDDYYAHRLAWLYMTGEWPKAFVDHVNLNKSDNRWKNLRAATKAQNSMNTRRSAKNKSGFKGVSWNTKRGAWAVFIERKFIGFFPTPEEAHAAYCAEAAVRFKDYARAA